MPQRAIKVFDFVIYWTIILIPFSMAIAPAPMNIFMGLLIVSFLAKKILKKERLFTKTALDPPLILLFSITFLSIFYSPDLKDTIRGGIFRLLQYIFVFFIMAEEVRERKHIRNIVWSISLGLILTSANEIFQVLTGKDFIRGYATVINIGIVRATSSFKDANTLGVYLSAISPLLLGLTMFYFKGKEKMFFVMVSLLALVGVVLTYSRPTILALYLILFFFGFVQKNKALITFMVIVTLVSMFIIPKSVKEWARQVEYNPLRLMCNDDRIAVYRNSLNMIKAHPLIGLGANTFMKNYRFYKEKPEYRNVVTIDYIYAHNNFLQMAAEIGLVGLGIFIWMLYKLFQETTEIYQKLGEPYLKIVSLSLVACLVAFLVNGLTESSLYSGRVAMIFWYLAGLAIGLKQFIHADKQGSH